MRIPIQSTVDLGLAVRAVRRHSRVRIDDLAATAGVSKQFTTTLATVTRESILSAGEVLGLPRRLGERELDRLRRNLLPALNALEQRIERENADYPEPVRVFLGGERRLVSTIKHVIVRDMLQRLDTAR